MSESDSSKLGEFKSLWILFLPLLGTAFSNQLFALLEKVFLTGISEVAMESALNATYACQIFQYSSVALVLMGQVTIATLSGSRKDSLIGSSLWQFIWASFLSMMITVPGSLLYGMWYFKGTEIESAVLPYFHLLTWFNFLYPLGACLSCFYLGRGKTKFILVISLVDQILKNCLSYVLIFGFGSWIQPVGFLGGLYANLSTQGLLCIFLFAAFLKKKNRIQFQTHQFRFQATLFWKLIYPGIFRALNRACGFGSWAFIAHIMASKKGEALLILSIGGSINLLLPFIFEGLYQAQTILISRLTGAGKVNSFSKATRSGLLIATGSIILFVIPLIIFPVQTFKSLFPTVHLSFHAIHSLMFGIWLWFSYSTLSAVPLSYMLAFKDTKFYFLTGALFWFTDYFLMYFLMDVVRIESCHFWTALAIVQMMNVLPLYFLRMNFLCKREELKQVLQE